MNKKILYFIIWFALIVTLALLIYKFGYSNEKKLYNFPRNSYGDNWWNWTPKTQFGNWRQ